jgi:hypothetical protein
MLEDRVRGAIRAKAGEIPPGALPPLRLPARRQPARRGLFGRLPGRRGLSLAAPIAAAVAVAAVIAAVFAAAGAIHHGAPPRPRPVVAPSTPPRYYVALTFTGNGQCCKPHEPSSPRTDAVVRVTATGQAVAMIKAPRPYGTFTGVSAAADDRTFVLAAQRLAPQTSPQPTKFFLLRLGPGGRPARLTPLRLPPLRLPTRRFPPPPANAEVTDFALSPDGTLLAVAAGSGAPVLYVFNLATGTERSWLPQGIGTSTDVGATQDSLSWTTDGRTLALIYWGRPNGGGVRLLDVAARGSNLLANSRLAVGQPANAAGQAYWIQARVTPDGRTVVGIRDRGPHFAQQLVEFSAQTGQARRVLSDIPAIYADNEKVEWASPSGGILIVTDAKSGHARPLGPFDEIDAGVLTGGHYTPLPWSGDIFAAAW